MMRAKSNALVSASYPDPGTYIRRIGERWALEKIDSSGASRLIYLTSEPQDGAFESRSSRPQDVDFLADRDRRRVGVPLSRRYLEHGRSAFYRVLHELAKFVLQSHRPASSRWVRRPR
jgi:hypothetical protein